MVDVVVLGSGAVVEETLVVGIEVADVIPSFLLSGLRMR
jgi:hypothetical protein